MKSIGFHYFHYNFVFLEWKTTDSLIKFKYFFINDFHYYRMEFYVFFFDFHDSQMEFYGFHDFRDSFMQFIDFIGFLNSRTGILKFS